MTDGTPFLMRQISDAGKALFLEALGSDDAKVIKTTLGKYSSSQQQQADDDDDNLIVIRLISHKASPPIAIELICYQHEYNLYKSDKYKMQPEEIIAYDNLYSDAFSNQIASHSDLYRAFVGKSEDNNASFGLSKEDMIEEILKYGTCIGSLNDEAHAIKEIKKEVNKYGLLPFEVMKDDHDILPF